MSLRVKLIAAFLLLAILTLGAITVYSYCDREIEPTTPPEAYLTLFMGVLDTRSNTLRYVNAGHHTQFALRSTGTPERSED
ncbi:MAG: hypothetical protein FJW35_16095, partial [Acidobacteria bacterium]|nr:hypothetical protein [Acidobacteriota bacterium]